MQATPFDSAFGHLSSRLGVNPRNRFRTDGQDEQITHELHVIMIANNRKTAPQELFALHFYEFAMHRLRRWRTCTDGPVRLQVVRMGRHATE